MGILPVVGTDGSQRGKVFGRFRTHKSPEGDFYFSNVESESARATGGARLGSPIHFRIFRVFIGGSKDLQGADQVRPESDDPSR